MRGQSVDCPRFVFPAIALNKMQGQVFLRSPDGIGMTKELKSHGARLYREYYAYIMTNGIRTLYLGVTNNLARRVYEHRQKLMDGFSKKYNITFPVYYETTNDVGAARAREEQLKGWRRGRKTGLIEASNPQRVWG